MELLTAYNDIAEMLNPALALIDVAGETPQRQQGWAYGNGVFTAPLGNA